MFKLATIVSLMLIASWSQADTRKFKKDASRDFEPGSTIWAQGLSCEVCGRECESACGTRHFRACCFNYLKKKRSGSDPFHEHKPYVPDRPQLSKRLPIFAIEAVQDPWYTNMAADPQPAEFQPYVDDLPLPFV